MSRDPHDLTFGQDEDDNSPHVERRPCPSCGFNSRIITRGDSRATVVSKCCETPLDGDDDEPHEDDEPEVLIEDGQLVCPWPDCGIPGNIVELDVASRENVLAVAEDGVITAHLGDSSFEGDGFECLSCNRAVSIPDSHEIVHA